MIVASLGFRDNAHPASTPPVRPYLPPQSVTPTRTQKHRQVYFTSHMSESSFTAAFNVKVYQGARVRNVKTKCVWSEKR